VKNRHETITPMRAHDASAKRPRSRGM
jgi:hypothetical protein